MSTTKTTDDRQLAVRGLVLGNGIPRICVPVTASDMGSLRAELGEVSAAPCDLIEWRADFFEETEGMWVERALDLLRDRLGDRPVLFTFRTKEEGGMRQIAMEEYEALNLRAVRCGNADLADVELNRGEERFQRLVQEIHALGGRVVGSYHDFSSTPARQEIERILMRMQDMGADITKAAVMPQSEEDVLTLLSASVEMKKRHADRPFITMAMGRLGTVSRLCGSLTGSAVTFATAGRASAPGQIDAQLMARLLPQLRDEHIGSERPDLS